MDEEEVVELVELDDDVEPHALPPKRLPVACAEALGTEHKIDSQQASTVNRRIITPSVVWAASLRVGRR